MAACRRSASEASIWQSPSTLRRVRSRRRCKVSANVLERRRACKAVHAAGQPQQHNLADAAQRLEVLSQPHPAHLEAFISDSLRAHDLSQSA